MAWMQDVAGWWPYPGTLNAKPAEESIGRLALRLGKPLIEDAEEDLLWWAGRLKLPDGWATPALLVLPNRALANGRLPVLRFVAPLWLRGTLRDGDRVWFTPSGRS